MKNQFVLLTCVFLLFFSSQSVAAQDQTASGFREFKEYDPNTTMLRGVTYYFDTRKEAQLFLENHPPIKSKEKVYKNHGPHEVSGVYYDHEAKSLGVKKWWVTIWQYTDLLPGQYKAEFSLPEDLEVIREAWNYMYKEFGSTKPDGTTRRIMTKSHVTEKEYQEYMKQGGIVTRKYYSKIFNDPVYRAKIIPELTRKDDGLYTLYFYVQTSIADYVRYAKSLRNYAEDKGLIDNKDYQPGEISHREFGMRRFPLVKESPARPEYILKGKEADAYSISVRHKRGGELVYYHNMNTPYLWAHLLGKAEDADYFYGEKTVQNNRIVYVDDTFYWRSTNHIISYSGTEDFRNRLLMKYPSSIPKDFKIDLKLHKYRNAYYSLDRMTTSLMDTEDASFHFYESYIHLYQRQFLWYFDVPLLDTTGYKFSASEKKAHHTALKRWIATSLHQFAPRGKVRNSIPSLPAYKDGRGPFAKYYQAYERLPNLNEMQLMYEGLRKKHGLDPSLGPRIQFSAMVPARIQDGDIKYDQYQKYKRHEPSRRLNLNEQLGLLKKLEASEEIVFWKKHFKAKIEECEALLTDQIVEP